MRRPPVLDPLIAQTKRVTNGAFTMQAVRCGHRAGISGSFRETLATDRPHMRQSKPWHDATSRKFREMTFLTHAFGSAAA